jgi:hypothetical protein
MIRAALVALVLSLGLGAPSATATAPVDTDAPITIGTNEFIPEGVNIGDCLSSMPRPNCGTKNRSGTGTLLTFGVLLLGTGFIGWRIARSVRARDRDRNG